MPINLNVFIVISGSSTAGKDTVKYKLLELFPTLHKIITTTTRDPRHGEIDGEDLHFVTVEEFKKMEKNGDFIETVEYAGNYYGTTKKAILEALDKDVIWRIDPSRAAKVREMIKESFPSDVAERLIKKLVVIYLHIPLETTRQRLAKRGVSDEEVEVRINQDRSFWELYKDAYDYTIENKQGELDKTMEKILQLVKRNESI